MYSFRNSLLFFMSVVFWLSPVQARIWKELEGVYFLTNEANDGDSFHAKRNTTEYLFRLYYVDTPESNIRYPDRVKEQADYFGLSMDEAVEGAKKASEFTEKLLSDKVFSVFTRYDDARGASKMKRYYAMVRVDGRWLSELLVENGFARVYGVRSELPDGTDTDKYWSRLHKLEKEAQAENRGLWGMASGKVDVASITPGQKVTLPRSTVIFASAPPHQAVGQLPAQGEVTLGESTRPGFRDVDFVSPGGHSFSGELQEAALK
jgi:endonuclease YncB( thermonuclease family)